MSSSASDDRSVGFADRVVGMLERLPDVTRADDPELRDRLVEIERARNALEAEQAKVMLHMLHRAHADDVADTASMPVTVPTGTREEFVIDEIAVHLGCTRMAASHRFGVALGAREHPALLASWSTGSIDARKVAVISDGLTGIDPVSDPVLADRILGAAVDYATGHTAPQLRQWLSRRVIAADPAAAERRRERATAGRRVTLIPLPDGVTELTALMPSVQARQIYDAIDAIARGAGADDSRSMDQRRSDALFDILTGRAQPPKVHIQVVVPADTLTGVGDHPGWVPGIGPVTAHQSRELAGAGSDGGCHCQPGSTTPSVGDSCTTWRRLITDPNTGGLLDISERRYRPSAGLEWAVRTRDVTCRFPGCRRSAATNKTGTDLDHVIAWPDGPTSSANLAALCRRHHRLKHSPNWHADLHPDGTMTWTTPGGRTFTTYPWEYTEPRADPDDGGSRSTEAA